MNSIYQTNETEKRCLESESSLRSMWSHTGHCSPIGHRKIGLAILETLSMALWILGSLLRMKAITMRIVQVKFGIRKEKDCDRIESWNTFRSAFPCKRFPTTCWRELERPLESPSIFQAEI